MIYSVAIACTSAGWLLLLILNPESLWAALTLSFAIQTAVFFQGRWMAKELNDPKLAYAGCFALLKMPLCLLIILFGWMPDLHDTSTILGSDPQRFYHQSVEMAESSSPSNTVLPVNYVGILYYYFFIIKLFGRHPVYPALINGLISFQCMILLTRWMYHLKPRRDKTDWTIGLFILIPEYMWFDSITSRETIVAAICVFILYVYFREQSSATFDLVRYPIFSGLVIFLGIIRTSMLIPIMLIIIILSFLKLPSRRSTPAMVMTAIIFVAAGLLSPEISVQLGSTDFAYVDLVEVAAYSDPEVISPEGWSERSIGRMLVPKSLLEVFLFALPRVLIYIVSPLPTHLYVPFNAIIAGSWDAWQSLVTILSSILYVVLLPVGIAGVVSFYKDSTLHPKLIIYVPTLVLLVAIGVGVPIIHERYRVMAIPFLWTTMWLGRSASRNLLLKSYCWAAICCLALLMVYLCLKIL